MYLDILETLWVTNPPINVDFFQSLNTDNFSQQSLSFSVVGEPYTEQFPIVRSSGTLKNELLFFDQIFGTDANFRCYKSSSDGVVLEFYKVGNNSEPFKVL